MSWERSHLCALSPHRLRGGPARRGRFRALKHQTPRRPRGGARPDRRVVDRRWPGRGALRCIRDRSTAADTYTWKNARIDGGGFVPGIVFNRSEKNLAYARTDIGGA
ncbi:hypothetical protein, partial [Streptomyces sp. NRRL WC-3549]|uniref:hypothetical protein n=1 Tax=Streptomyces sp. NRRL WC-3549 TaxID=1463925 RepID=UPI001F183B8F